MGWESVYRGSLDANLVDSAGWIRRNHLASTTGLKREIPKSTARICVGMAIEEGLLATHPRYPSRLKPWKHEKIELEAGGEIRISYLRDHSDGSPPASELAELLS